jgi:preprotein translocase subunit SecG
MFFWTDIAINTLLFLYVIDALLMCLIVLMQRSKQEGLGAAFGGGFTESVWGAQTSQVLVKATVWLAFIFFAISILLARLYSYRQAHAAPTSTLDQELLKPVPAIVTNVAPVAPITPSAAAPANSAPATSTTASPLSTTPAGNAAPAAPAKPAAK